MERKHVFRSKTFKINATVDGVIHAAVGSWAAWGDSNRTSSISTHYEDTKDHQWGFARDLQWGQTIQLIEDVNAAKIADHNSPPEPFTVKAGEPLLLTVLTSKDRHKLQFLLER